MVYDYNKLYGTTKAALGEPTQVFVDFFHRLKRDRLRVLDVGCGQGRDALFIARLGHSVVGVDISANGIDDLVNAARLENLEISGITADITRFTPDGDFDVVLIDRTLHMLAEAERLEALGRLVDHVSPDGWLLIADERANIAGIKRCLASQNGNWEIDFEKNGYLFARKSRLPRQKP